MVALVLGGCAHAIDERSSMREGERKVEEAMRSYPVVLLGEVHDNVAQHRLRAAALDAWLASGARPALLMEQFDRERQAAIDQALARPGVTPDDVIAAGSKAGEPMTGWSWPLYRPYLAAAIEYRLPIVAVNVSREDTRAIVEHGLAASGFDARVPDDIRAAQGEAIVDGHCGLIDAATAARLSDAQVARDQSMARAVEAHANGAVLLAGDGHVRNDIGVPRWLAPATRTNSVSIGLVEDEAPDVTIFDVTVITPAQARANPCEAMRRGPRPKVR